MNDGMQFEKFDVAEGHVGPTQDVEIGPEGTPTGSQDTLETALGLEGAEIEAPEDPDVQRFLDVSEGKQVEKPVSDKDTNQTLSELLEANKRLASRLGEQGNNVVGPLRQENEQLRERLARLEGMMQTSQQNQPAPDQGKMLEDTIRNLYGPEADVSDPAYRAHAQAHINAGNRLGEAVENNFIGPLRSEIDKLKAQLAEAQVSSVVPKDQAERLVQQYPSLGALSPEQRASVMQDMLRSRPTPQPMEPEHYVEPTTSSAPVKPTQQAALQEFDSMSAEQQQAALGHMLAQRGLRGLGR